MAAEPSLKEQRQLDSPSAGTYVGDTLGTKDGGDDTVGISVGHTDGTTDGGDEMVGAEVVGDKVGGDGQTVAPVVVTVGQ